MSLEKIKKEMFDDIYRNEEEWKKHRTMKNCSVCDSFEGHTSIKEIVGKSIKKAHQAGKKEALEVVEKEFDKWGEKTFKEVLKNAGEFEDKNTDSRFTSLWDESCGYADGIKASGEKLKNLINRV